MAVPFVHAPDLERGKPERLSSRITRIIAHNPGPFTYTGSGTYLVIGRSETFVIDPGPDEEAHQELTVRAAPSPISKILITHSHLDHCGGAARLKALTGAEVLAFDAHPDRSDTAAPPALDEGGDLSFRPDRELGDGERIAADGLTMTAVHTPGHLSNHLCFALEEEEALFTGDHVMGWATTVIAPPDGNIADYMASLDRLLERSDRIYYPTHGAPIEQPAEFVRAVKAHRQARDRAFLEVLSRGPAELMVIVDEVYADLNPGLRIAAGLNVQAHLEAHQATGRVVREGQRYRLTDEGP